MLGKFRGKVGATVFRTEAGIGQIASEYNPNPKNPRTLAQTKQRSKMNLAGLTSKLTPFAAIAGLDSNRRKARSLFVGNMLRSIEITGKGTVAEPFVASIAPGAVKFSKGVNVQLTAGQITITNNTLQCTVSTGKTAAEIPQMVAIAMINIAGELKSVAVGSFNNVEGDVAVSLPVGTLSQGDSANLFVIPIFAGNGAAAFLADVDVDWANSKYAVSVARTLSTLNAYGESSFVGTVNFT